MFRLVAALLLSLVVQAHAAWEDFGPPGAVSVVASGVEGINLIARRTNAAPLRSRDGGESWVSFSVNGQWPEVFVPSPTDGGTFYALIGGAASGVGGFEPQPSAFARSRDGGANWELLSTALRGPDGKPLGYLAVGARPDLLYASRVEVGDCTIGCTYTGVGVYLSRDAGSTWQKIDAGLNTGIDSIQVLPSISHERTAYAAMTSGLYRTDDQGATWRKVLATSLQNQFLFYFLAFPRPLAVDRFNPDIVHLAPGGSSSDELWSTDDGGATWRKVTGLNLPGVSRALLPDPLVPGRAYFAGNEGQLLRTDDAGRTWQRIVNASGQALEVGYYRFAGTQPMLFARGTQRIYTSGFNNAPNPPMPKRIAFGEDAFALGSDLWWTPGQPGTGVGITQHASGQVFVTWYGVESGRPVWRAISGGQWTDARTFTGTLYDASGPAFFEGPFDPARVRLTPAGTATLRFVDDQRATFSWRFAGGANGALPIERYAFAPPALASDAVFGDLWYDAQAPGWGVSVSHQYNKIFMAWYAYDAQGRATWFTVPDTANSRTIFSTSDQRPSFGGKAYRSQGTTQVEAGRAVITFLADGTARLDYVIDGTSGSRTLSRLPF